MNYTLYNSYNEYYKYYIKLLMKLEQNFFLKLVRFKVELIQLLPQFYLKKILIPNPLIIIKNA